MGTIDTGILIPRDYGVIRTFGRKTPDTFESPSRVAVGALFLESKEDLQQRIHRRARRIGTEEEAGWRDFVRGIERRRLEHVLSTPPGQKVHGIDQYGMKHDALVLSRAAAAGTGEPHHVTLARQPRIPATELAYAQPNCDCEDHRYAELNNLDLFCVHAEALRRAVVRDNMTRRPAERNITGLPPRERFDRSAVAFNLYSRHPKEGVDARLTDLLWSYVVKRRNHFETSVAALDDHALYTDALVQSLRTGDVRIGVLRGKEATRERDTLTGADAEHFTAIHALVHRLERFLTEEKRYTPHGYGLEFKGTPYQMVARRFVRRDSKAHRVVTIAAGFDGRGQPFPPLVVQRSLLSFAEGNYANTTEDFAGTAIPMSPYRRLARDGHRKTYPTIDDGTRRHARTQVTIPGEGSLDRIEVAGILRAHYDSLCNT